MPAAELALLHVNVIDNIGKARRPFSVDFFNTDVGAQHAALRPLSDPHR